MLPSVTASWGTRGQAAVYSRICQTAVARSCGACLDRCPQDSFNDTAAGAEKPEDSPKPNTPSGHQCTECCSPGRVHPLLCNLTVSSGVTLQTCFPAAVTQNVARPPAAYVLQQAARYKTMRFAQRKPDPQILRKTSFKLPACSRSQACPAGPFS
jgi:hypothetical protein